MSARIVHIASNTFREAVRDRVLYNLIAFALLLSGAAILVGQISIDIERLVVINLGLTAVSLFGVVIAIFIGIGLVSKEIEKRTLYTVLSRPVRRWEFIVGKFFGLAGTLVVNTFFMAIGVFAALLYVSHKFTRPDALILVALYFIVLQFFIQVPEIIGLLSIAWLPLFQKGEQVAIIAPVLSQPGIIRHIYQPGMGMGYLQRLRKRRDRKSSIRIAGR